MSSKWLAPQTCPDCGDRTVFEIIYGYPTSELFQAGERGEVIIGGCCIQGPVIGRQVECTECGWTGVSFEDRLISTDEALVLERRLKPFPTL
jgi:hypothetical protein